MCWLNHSLVYLLKVYCHRCVYSYVSATDFVPIFVEYILGISRFVENWRSHLSVYININKMCQLFTVQWYNTTCSTTMCIYYAPQKKTLNEREKITLDSQFWWAIFHSPPIFKWQGLYSVQCVMTLLRTLVVFCQ